MPYQREQLTSIMHQFIESKTGFYITKRQANSKEYRLYLCHTEQHFLDSEQLLADHHPVAVGEKFHQETTVHLQVEYNYSELNFARYKLMQLIHDVVHFINPLFL